MGPVLEDLALTGWIQHPDLSSDDLGGLSKSQAVERFDGHDWDAELTWLKALKVGSREWCPPGMGLVEDGGRILRLCPLDKSQMRVHYHFPASRGLGRWLGSRMMKTVGDMPLSLGTDLIRRFYRSRHDEFMAQVIRTTELKESPVKRVTGLGGHLLQDSGPQVNLGLVPTTPRHRIGGLGRIRLQVDRE